LKSLNLLFADVLHLLF